MKRKEQIIKSIILLVQYFIIINVFFSLLSLIVVGTNVLYILLNIVKWI